MSYKRTNCAEGCLLSTESEHKDLEVSRLFHLGLGRWSHGQGLFYPLLWHLCPPFTEGWIKTGDLLMTHSYALIRPQRYPYIRQGRNQLSKWQVSVLWSRWVSWAGALTVPCCQQLKGQQCLPYESLRLLAALTYFKLVLFSFKFRRWLPTGILSLSTPPNTHTHAHTHLEASGPIWEGTKGKRRQHGLEDRDRIPQSPAMDFG